MQPEPVSNDIMFFAEIIICFYVKLQTLIYENNC
jgi:hypothetical protein